MLFSSTILYMTKLYFSLCLVFSSITLISQTLYVYPETRKVNQKDTFFGQIIEDPYRWLEEQESSETKQWVKQQDDIARNYLDKTPNNFTLREQIKRNTEVNFLAPTKNGDYYFILQTAFGGKELHIYFKKDLKKDYWEELFVTKDLKVNKDENISISQYEVSKDSKYIAYAFDKNGSDWKEIKVADLQKQKNLDDHLYDIKFSDIVWRGNGFYYTKYERKAGDEQYKQLAKNSALYYHKLGTAQDKDSLIFKKSDAPSNIFSTFISRDERFLIIRDNDPVKNMYAYYYFDFENKMQAGLLPLFKKSNKRYGFLGSKNDSLYFMITMNDKKSVVKMNPKNPTKLIEVGSKTESLIVRDVIYHKGFFYKLCFYNEQELIVVFNEKGDIVKKVEIPFGSFCDFKGVDLVSNKLLLSYYSLLHPPIYAGLDLTTLQFELLESVKINYSMGDFVIEKVMYKSDTVMVPMLLMHQKNMKFDSSNPTLIEFYGGYGKIMELGFDPGKISFVENGGVYAYAMIRGGGEKGDYWHQDGKLTNRQKSINDIVNAANYLIDKKIAQSSKIAISGASHGGLMTAAVAMQHPELFAAAVPVVGVYDMLRFEKFTIGSFHIDEFGSVKDSLMFINLKSYSPLHQVQKGVKYPAMLFMTSVYDDRVPPLHSYKMVATMQELASKENPILLRVEKNAGHNGSRTYNRYIDESTDFYSFILNALSVKKYK